MFLPIKIFFCYAHEDEPQLKKLKTHLRPLQRQRLVDVWHDRDIKAGTEWEQEIKKHIDEAQIILLLVSPDFIDSDYCYSIEMKHAIERHQRGEVSVIPIILRHVYWQGEPLGKLQALPTDAEPVTSRSWHTQDEAFFNVAEGIRKVVEELVAANLINELQETQKQSTEQGLYVYNYKLEQQALRTLEAYMTPFSSKSPGLFDKDKKELNFKIVYYGIGLCGKTTNLHFINQIVNPQDVGEMISIESYTERTIYFDLLPLELGKVHDFRIRFNLYTVSGWLLYKQSRVSLLKGANCVIFVADSQAQKLQENVECYNELHEQLQLMNKDITTFPLIMQWNKRDLADILPVSVLEHYLNPYHVPSFDAVAILGKGVLECLRAAINKALLSLKRD